MMPYMDGISLIKALRKMNPGIPIIASTGLGEKVRIAELAGMEVKAILHKPFGATPLLQALHDALHPAAAG
jgi:CheY-like chemotaxis protein